MSGIVGYIGKRNAQPILLEALEQLDYRGYDSAGILISNGLEMGYRRTVGRIKDLRNVLLREPLGQGTIGIAHTRWATHGTPSEANSHPLSGCDQRYYIVHNGIIENYISLKKSLLQKGHRFSTETDTEVIPHLLEEYEGVNLEDTVKRILPLLKGSFALAIMAKHQPDQIVAVSQDNPLVIGFGKGEAFLASDIPALMPYTREIYPIKNGEIAVLSGAKVMIHHLDKGIIETKKTIVGWNPQDVMLNDYEHYMIKEIFEQKKAMEETLSPYLLEEGIHFHQLEDCLNNRDIQDFKKIHIVASGTSFHSAMIGKKVMDQLLGVPVEVFYSSEFLTDHPPLDQRNLVIVLSQSGETADTLSALREARRYHSFVIAITNTMGSTITRKADCTIYTKAGPELAVASTKAHTTQVATLILLSIWLTKKVEGIAQEEVPMLLQALKRLPNDIESTLIMTQDAIDQFAQVIFDQEHLYLLGRGLDYVLALEGALKLQEVAYIHADAYPAGELKHGTMALITPGVPVIVLATQNQVIDKVINNIKEVKARSAFVMAITTVGDELISEEVDQVMYIPATHPYLMPILAAIPLQLLAYYSGIVRDHDVDRPRNLAKSLTVE